MTTPNQRLRKAAFDNDLETILNLLSEDSIDPNTMEQLDGVPDGETPISLCLFAISEMTPQIVRALLRAGANPMIGDDNALLPWHKVLKKAEHHPAEAPKILEALQSHPSIESLTPEIATSGLGKSILNLTLTPTSIPTHQIVGHLVKPNFFTVPSKIIHLSTGGLLSDIVIESDWLTRLNQSMIICFSTKYSLSHLLKHLGGCYVHLREEKPSNLVPFLHEYLYIQNANTTNLYYVTCDQKIKKESLKQSDIQLIELGQIDHQSLNSALETSHPEVYQQCMEIAPNDLDHLFKRNDEIDAILTSIIQNLAEHNKTITLLIKQNDEGLEQACQEAIVCIQKEEMIYYVDEESQRVTLGSINNCVNLDVWTKLTDHITEKKIPLTSQDIKALFNHKRPDRFVDNDETIRSCKMIYARVSGKLDTLGPISNERCDLIKHKFTEGILECSKGFGGRVQYMTLQFINIDTFEGLLYKARELIIKGLSSDYDEIHNHIFCHTLGAFAFGTLPINQGDHFHWTDHSSIMKNFIIRSKRALRVHHLAHVIEKALQSELETVGYPAGKTAEGHYLVDIYQPIVEQYIQPIFGDQIKFSDVLVLDKHSGTYVIDINWPYIQQLIIDKLQRNFFSKTYHAFKSVNMITLWLPEDDKDSDHHAVDFFIVNRLSNEELDEFYQAYINRPDTSQRFQHLLMHDAILHGKKQIVEYLLKVNGNMHDAFIDCHTENNQHEQSEQLMDYYKSIVIKYYHEKFKLGSAPREAKTNPSKPSYQRPHFDKEWVVESNLLITLFQSKQVDESMMDIVLANTANVNAGNIDGWTALHQLAHMSKFYGPKAQIFYRKLLERNVDVLQTTKKGYRASDFATDYTFRQILLLKEVNLSILSSNHVPSSLEELVFRGAPLDAPLQYGNSHAYQALMEEQEASIKIRKRGLSELKRQVLERRSSLTEIYYQRLESSLLANDLVPVGFIYQKELPIIRRVIISLLQAVFDYYPRYDFLNQSDQTPPDHWQVLTDEILSACSLKDNCEINTNTLQTLLDHINERWRNDKPLLAISLRLETQTIEAGHAVEDTLVTVHANTDHCFQLIDASYHIAPSVQYAELFRNLLFQGDFLQSLLNARIHEQQQSSLETASVQALIHFQTVEGDLLQSTRNFSDFCNKNIFPKDIDEDFAAIALILNKLCVMESQKHLSKPEFESTFVTFKSHYLNAIQQSISEELIRRKKISEQGGQHSPIKQLEQEILSKDKQIEDATQSIKTLEDSLKNEDVQQAALEAKRAEFEAQFSKEIEAIQAKIRRHEQQLSEKEAEIITLKQRHDAKNAAIEKIESEQTELLEKIEALREKERSLNEQHLSIKNELTALEQNKILLERDESNLVTKVKFAEDNKAQAELEKKTIVTLLNFIKACQEAILDNKSFFIDHRAQIRNKINEYEQAGNNQFLSLYQYLISFPELSHCASPEVESVAPHAVEFFDTCLQALNEVLRPPVMDIDHQQKVIAFSAYHISIDECLAMTRDFVIQQCESIGLDIQNNLLVVTGQPTKITDYPRAICDLIKSKVMHRDLPDSASDRDADPQWKLLSDKTLTQQTIASLNITYDEILTCFVKRIECLAGGNIYCKSTELTLPSVSISLIAAESCILPQSCHINTSGFPTPNTYEHRKARSGSAYRSNTNTPCGRDGDHGLAGIAGKHGGDIYINARDITHIDTLTCTANGSDGMHGQEAGDGDKGAPSPYTTPDASEGKLKHWRVSSVYSQARIPAIAHNGQIDTSEQSPNGGNAGNAGLGGEGGIAGDIIIEFGDNRFSLQDGAAEQEGSAMGAAPEERWQSSPGSNGQHANLNTAVGGEAGEAGRLGRSAQLWKTGLLEWRTKKIGFIKIKLPLPAKKHKRHGYFHFNYKGSGSIFGRDVAPYICPAICAVEALPNKWLPKWMRSEMIREANGADFSIRIILKGDWYEAPRIPNQIPPRSTDERSRGRKGEDCKKHNRRHPLSTRKPVSHTARGEAYQQKKADQVKKLSTLSVVAKSENAHKQTLAHLDQRIDEMTTKITEYNADLLIKREQLNATNQSIQEKTQVRENLAQAINNTHAAIQDANNSNITLSTELAQALQELASLANALQEAKTEHSAAVIDHQTAVSLAQELNNYQSRIEQALNAKQSEINENKLAHHRQSEALHALINQLQQSRSNLTQQYQHLLDKDRMLKDQIDLLDQALDRVNAISNQQKEAVHQNQYQVQINHDEAEDTQPSFQMPKDPEAPTQDTAEATWISAIRSVSLREGWTTYADLLNNDPNVCVEKIDHAFNLRCDPSSLEKFFKTLQLQLDLKLKSCHGLDMEFLSHLWKAVPAPLFESLLFVTKHHFTGADRLFDNIRQLSSWDVSEKLAYAKTLFTYLAGYERVDPAAEGINPSKAEVRAQIESVCAFLPDTPLMDDELLIDLLNILDIQSTDDHSTNYFLLVNELYIASQYSDHSDREVIERLSSLVPKLQSMLNSARDTQLQAMLLKTYETVLAMIATAGLSLEEMTAANILSEIQTIDQQASPYLSSTAVHRIFEAALPHASFSTASLIELYQCLPMNHPIQSWIRSKIEPMDTNELSLMQDALRIVYAIPEGDLSPAIEQHQATLLHAWRSACAFSKTAQARITSLYYQLCSQQVGFSIDRQLARWHDINEIVLQYVSTAEYSIFSDALVSLSTRWVQEAKSQLTEDLNLEVNLDDWSFIQAALSAIISNIIENEKVSPVTDQCTMLINYMQSLDVSGVDQLKLFERMILDAKDTKLGLLSGKSNSAKAITLNAVFEQVDEALDAIHMTRYQARVDAIKSAFYQDKEALNRIHDDTTRYGKFYIGKNADLAKKKQAFVKLLLKQALDAGIDASQHSTVSHLMYQINQYHFNQFPSLELFTTAAFNEEMNEKIEFLRAALRNDSFVSASLFDAWHDIMEICLEYCDKEVDPAHQQWISDFLQDSVVLLESLYFDQVDQQRSLARFATQIRSIARNEAWLDIADTLELAAYKHYMYRDVTRLRQRHDSRSTKALRHDIIQQLEGSHTLILTATLQQLRNADIYDTSSIPTRADLMNRALTTLSIEALRENPIESSDQLLTLCDNVRGLITPKDASIEKRWQFVSDALEALSTNEEAKILRKTANSLYYTACDLEPDETQALELAHTISTLTEPSHPASIFCESLLSLANTLLLPLILSSDDSEIHQCRAGLESLVASNPRVALKMLLILSHPPEERRESLEQLRVSQYPGSSEVDLADTLLAEFKETKSISDTAMLLIELSENPSDLYKTLATALHEDQANGHAAVLIKRAIYHRGHQQLPSKTLSRLLDGLDQLSLEQAFKIIEWFDQHPTLPVAPLQSLFVHLSDDVDTPQDGTDILQMFMTENETYYVDAVSKESRDSLLSKPESKWLLELKRAFWIEHCVEPYCRPLLEQYLTHPDYESLKYHIDAYIKTFSVDSTKRRLEQLVQMTSQLPLNTHFIYTCGLIAQYKRNMLIIYSKARAKQQEKEWVEFIRRINSLEPQFDIQALNDLFETMTTGFDAIHANKIIETYEPDQLEHACLAHQVKLAAAKRVDGVSASEINITDCLLPNYNTNGGLALLKILRNALILNANDPMEKISLDHFNHITRQLVELGVYNNDFIIKELEGQKISYWPIVLERLKIAQQLNLDLSVKKHRQLLNAVTGLQYRILIEDYHAITTHLFTATSLPIDDLHAIFRRFSTDEWSLTREIITLLKNLPTEQWLSFLEAHYEAELKADQGERSISKINSIMLSKESSINAAVRTVLEDSETGLEHIYEKIQAKYQELAEIQDIHAFKEAFIDFQDSTINSTDFQFLRNGNDDDLVTVIAYLNKACELANQFTLRDAQIAGLILFAKGYDTGKGRLANISTGQGKTLMTQCLAIMSVLRGERVDVITSSPKLAIRDAGLANELMAYFSITVHNNCDDKSLKSPKVRKQRYQDAQVIYGDVGSFQRDQLLTDHYQKAIRPQKVNRVILDEVDSMFIDSMDRVLYISHTIHDLGHLRDLFLFLWQCVNAPDAKTYSHQNLDKITQLFNKSCEEGTLIIPNHLKPFVTRRLPIWIKNAYAAKQMENERQYRLPDDENYAHTPVIMDLSTGVEQFNSQWSNGLFQFIQLKHRKKLTDETLRAIFVSNLSYFKQFSGQIFGMTGTLGDENERNLLAKSYKVDFFELPRFCRWKFREESAIVIGKDEDRLWEKTIFNQVIHKINTDSHKGFTAAQQAQAREKMTEHMETVDEIKAQIVIEEDTLKAAQQKYYLMKRDLKTAREHARAIVGDEEARAAKLAEVAAMEEKLVEQNKVVQTSETQLSVYQDTINETVEQYEYQQSIALNQDSRAILLICEDRQAVKTLRSYFKQELMKLDHPSVNKIYTYDSFLQDKPKEILQAGDIVIATNIAGRGTDFGITETVNKNGGLYVGVTFLPSNVRIQYQNFGRGARKDQSGSGQLIVADSRANGGREVPIELLIAERNERERARLARIEKVKVPQLALEQTLFEKLIDLEKHISTTLEAQSLPDWMRSLQQKSLRNAWAFWLDQENGAIKNTYMTGDAEVLAAFDRFKQEQLAKLESVDMLINEPAELLILARHYINHENYQQAKRVCDRIIQDEPKLSGFAYYYKAHAIIGIRGDVTGRREAIDTLDKAIHLLEEESAAISSANQVINLVSKERRKQGVGESIDSFTQHNVERIGLINIHLSAARAAIGGDLSPATLASINISDDEAKVIFENVRATLPHLFLHRRIQEDVHIEQDPETGKNEIYLHEEKIQFPAQFAYCKQHIITELKAILEDQENAHREIDEEQLKSHFQTRETWWNLLKPLVNDSTFVKINPDTELAPDYWFSKVFGDHGRTIESVLSRYHERLDRKAFEAWLTEEAPSDLNISSIIVSLFNDNVLVEEAGNRFHTDTQVDIQRYLSSFTFKPNIALRSKLIAMKMGEHPEFARQIDDIIETLCQAHEENTPVTAQRLSLDDHRFRTLYKWMQANQLIENSLIEILNIDLDQRFATLFEDIIIVFEEQGMFSIEDLPFTETPEAALQQLWSFFTARNAVRAPKVKFGLHGSKGAIEDQLNGISNTVKHHFESLIRGLPEIEAKIEQRLTLQSELDAHVKKRKSLQPEDNVLLQYSEQEKRCRADLSQISDELNSMRDSIANSIQSGVGTLLRIANVENKPKHLSDSFEEVDLPDEIDAFIRTLRDLVINFIEKPKKSSSWGVICVALLGAAQIAAGVLIMYFCPAAAPLGQALISEGINDLCFALEAHFSGNFSWEAYGEQKKLSLALSLATAGIACGIGGVATNGASVLGQSMMKEFTEAAIDVAVTVMTNAIAAELGENITELLMAALNDTFKKTSKQLAESEINTFKSLIHNLMQSADEEKATQVIQQALQDIQLSKLIQQHAITKMQTVVNGMSSRLAKLKTNNQKSPIGKVISAASKVSDAMKLFDYVKSVASIAGASKIIIGKLNEALKKRTARLANRKSGLSDDAIQHFVEKQSENVIGNVLSQIQAQLEGAITRECASQLNQAIGPHVQALKNEMNARINTMYQDEIRLAAEEKLNIILSQIVEPDQPVLNSQDQAEALKEDKEQSAKALNDQDIKEVQTIEGPINPEYLPDTLPESSVITDILEGVLLFEDDFLDDSKGSKLKAAKHKKQGTKAEKAIAKSVFAGMDIKYNFIKAYTENSAGGLSTRDKRILLMVYLPQKFIGYVTNNNLSGNDQSGMEQLVDFAADEVTSYLGAKAVTALGIAIAKKAAPGLTAAAAGALAPAWAAAAAAVAGGVAAGMTAEAIGSLVTSAAEKLNENWGKSVIKEHSDAKSKPTKYYFAKSLHTAVSSAHQISKSWNNAKKSLFGKKEASTNQNKPTNKGSPDNLFDNKVNHSAHAMGGQ